jgi:hypothetical protein
MSKSVLRRGPRASPLSKREEKCLEKEPPGHPDFKKRE